MATIGRLSVNLIADTRKFKKGMRGASKELDAIKGRIFNVKSAILGAAGVAGFGAMVSSLIDTNKEMQTLRSSLKTVTGSVEESNKAFALIEDFAKTTPYDLNQVVGSFIKLKALGLDPSRKALESYGNTAAAMGKSLDQMIEAVADAATGEFERLKEFGIRASKQGDEVAFTFQGVTKTVKFNSEAITGYLRSIGDVNFAGAMADQMGNLAPAFSNLQAAWQSVQVTIGESGLNDFIVQMTTNMTDFLNSLSDADIQKFTSGVMTSFAGFLDTIDSAYQYVKGNSELQAMGIIGYLLFGKTGAAIALVIDKINTAAAQDMARIWELLNPSQVTLPGAGPNSDYQLGDFNNAQNPMNFDEWAKMVRSGDDQVKAQEETNSLLGDIADQLRDNAAVPAVAG